MAAPARWRVPEAAYGLLLLSALLHIGGIVADEEPSGGRGLMQLAPLVASAAEWPLNGCSPSAPFYVAKTSSCVAACPPAADGTPQYADAGFACRPRCGLNAPYNTSGTCTTLSTASKLALQSPAVGALLVPGRNVTLDIACQSTDAPDACRSTYVFELVAAGGAATRLASVDSPYAYDDRLGGCWQGCTAYWRFAHAALVPEGVAPGNYTLRATRTIQWCPRSAGWCAPPRRGARRAAAARARAPSAMLLLPNTPAALPVAGGGANLLGS